MKSRELHRYDRTKRKEPARGKLLIYLLPCLGVFRDKEDPFCPYREGTSHRRSPIETSQRYLPSFYDLLQITRTQTVREIPTPLNMPFLRFLQLGIFSMPGCQIWG